MENFTLSQALPHPAPLFSSDIPLYLNDTWVQIASVFKMRFKKHKNHWLEPHGVCRTKGIGSTLLLNCLHPPVLLLKVTVVNLGGSGLREANDGATAP